MLERLKSQEGFCEYCVTELFSWFRRCIKLVFCKGLPISKVAGNDPCNVARAADFILADFLPKLTNLPPNTLGAVAVCHPPA